jgi:hypothetical protein
MLAVTVVTPATAHPFSGRKPCSACHSLDRNADAIAYTIITRS